MASIIGAGPVGNYLAGLLVEKGVNVNVYEEHKAIGSPVACTGILTPYLQDVAKIDEEYIVNSIHETNVFSPDGNYVNIKLRKNYIVDRTLFDSYFGEIARAGGADYHIGWRLSGLVKKKDNFGYVLNFSNGKTRETDVVVGADGPSSIVARSAGLFGKREFVVGHQARVKVRDKVDDDIVEFFVGEGYIGWLVPEDSNVVRLGVGSRKDASFYFDRLLNMRQGKILEWQSGAIPLYNPKLKYEKDKVYLVGDAATQVKATTYGGIIPGMLAGQALCDAIVNGKPEGSYERGWRKKTGRELGLHLMMRNIMDRFSEKDFNELIGLSSQDKIKYLIGKYDREYPSKLIFWLGLREPRFLKYGKFLLKRK